MANEKDIVPVEGQMSITLFQDQQLRRVFHDDEWYLSVIDVVSSLTGSSNARRYWSDLKRKIESEGGELYERIVQLKMTGLDGKDRLTDAANIETVLRIVQSIPSPNAELFKRWLAQVGSERIQETENPGLAIERAINGYRSQGQTDEWISTRLKAIANRKDLTDEWSNRGIEGAQYGTLTNVISRETFDLDTQEHRAHKGLKKRDSLRDSMNDMELILTMLGERSAATITIARDAQGFEENRQAAHAGGKVAGNARRSLEEQIGQPVVSTGNKLRSSEEKQVRIAPNPALALKPKD